MRRLAFDAVSRLIMRNPRQPLKRALLRVGFLLRDRSATRRLALAPGVELECRLGSRYETMVWWRQEERDELALLQRQLRRGDTFVDCGANVGLWSLVAASSVGPSGTVLAFEAHPTTAARLERIVRDSSLACVTVHNVAVGESAGHITFMESDEHNMQSLLATSGARRITTPLVTLDEFHLPALHGMKIDVEGYEERVLLGATESLRVHRPWVVIEYNPFYMGSRTLADWPPHRLLAALGYDAYLANVDATEAGATPLPGTWSARRYVNLFYRASPAGRRA